nr:MAG TPA: hypothetical protein [Caudoviricetes sp.]
MTITELQRELQIIYERYGDLEVVIEDTDWTGVEIYHEEISVVKYAKYNGNVAVALENN